MNDQKLKSDTSDQWAIVELFGHQRIAGRVSEQTIGGSSFVRIDVPACEQHGSIPATQAFTKLYGQGAIYAISFVDEAAARMAARNIRVQPIDTFDLRRAVREQQALLEAPDQARSTETFFDGDAPPL